MPTPNIPPTGRTAFLSPTISLEKLTHGGVLSFVTSKVKESLGKSRAVSALPYIPTVAYRLVVPATTSGGLSPTPVYKEMGRIDKDQSLVFRGELLSHNPLPAGYTEVLRRAEAPPYLFLTSLEDASYSDSLFEKWHYYLVAKVPPHWLNTPVNIGRSLLAGAEHSKSLQWEIGKIQLTQKDLPAPAVKVSSSRTQIQKQAWKMRTAETNSLLLSHILMQPETNWIIERRGWGATITRYFLTDFWGIDDVMSRFSTVVNSNVKPLPKKTTNFDIPPTVSQGYWASVSYVMVESCWATAPAYQEMRLDRS